MLTVMLPDSFSNDHSMWKEAIRGAQDRVSPANGLTMTRLGAGKAGPRLASHSGLMTGSPAFERDDIGEAIDAVFPETHREHVKALAAWARQHAMPVHPLAVMLEATKALADGTYDPDRFVLDFWYPEDGVAPRETAVWATLAAEAARTHEVFVTTRSESVPAQVSEHVRDGRLQPDEVRVMLGSGPDQNIREARIDDEGRLRNFPIAWFATGARSSSAEKFEGGYTREDMQDAVRPGTTPDENDPPKP